METLEMFAPFLPWVGVVALWWRVAESKRKMQEEHEKEFEAFKLEMTKEIARLELEQEKNKNYGAICSNFKHVNSKQ